MGRHYGLKIVASCRKDMNCDVVDEYNCGDLIRDNIKNL